MDWNYIAGFFDGEGSLVYNKKRFRISITQTNRNVLDTIKTFTNFGYVIKIQKRKNHWKNSWMFYIAKQEDIRTFLLKIISHLIVKRALVKRVLKQLELTLIRRKEKQYKIEKRRLFVSKLRLKKLSYRQIGKKVGLDWGYVRRILIKQGMR